MNSSKTDLNSKPQQLIFIQFRELAWSLLVSPFSQRQRAQIESPKVTSHFGMILNQGTKAPFYIKLQRDSFIVQAWMSALIFCPISKFVNKQRKARMQKSSGSSFGRFPFSSLTGNKKWLTWSFELNLVSVREFLIGEHYIIIWRIVKTTLRPHDYIIASVFRFFLYSRKLNVGTYYLLNLTACDKSPRNFFEADTIANSYLRPSRQTRFYLNSDC